MTAIRNPKFPLIFSSRESLLSANSELIAQLQNRLNQKRFRPQAADSLKLAYMRVYLEALKVQSALLTALELEDMKQRLEVLEAMQAGSLAEEQVYNSDLERNGDGNISEFEEQS